MTNYATTLRGVEYCNESSSMVTAPMASAFEDSQDISRTLCLFPQTMYITSEMTGSCLPCRSLLSGFQVEDLKLNQTLALPHTSETVWHFYTFVWFQFTLTYSHSCWGV